MHQLYNNKIPFLFQDKFTKLEKIDSRKMRKPSSFNFFLPRVLKNAGQTKTEFRVKLWNSLDENLKSKSFILFEIIKKSSTTLLKYINNSTIENQDENGFDKFILFSN